MADTEQDLKHALKTMEGANALLATELERAVAANDVTFKEGYRAGLEIAYAIVKRESCHIDARLKGMIEEASK